MARTCAHVILLMSIFTWACTTPGMSAQAKPAATKTFFMSLLQLPAASKLRRGLYDPISLAKANDCAPPGMSEKDANRGARPRDVSAAFSPNARSVLLHSQPASQRSFLRVLLLELQPHRVEDREGAGKAEAEDPGKIPHRRALPSVVIVVAALNRGLGDDAAKHAVGPGRVGEDDRQEYDHDEQHQEQRRPAGGGVPDRQAVVRIARGGHQEGKRLTPARQDHAGDRHAAEPQRRPGVSLE